jgi:hypothetical protein
LNPTPKASTFANCTKPTRNPKFAKELALPTHTEINEKGEGIKKCISNKGFSDKLKVCSIERSPPKYK